jgi:hypothetical protein
VLPEAQLSLWRHVTAKLKPHASRLQAAEQGLAAPGAKLKTHA